MSDILEKICADKRSYVEASKRVKSFSTMHREALRGPALRGFSRALRNGADRDGAAFICEIKKASPSAGLLRDSFSPRALAQSYAQAGASCLSVLTDEPYFQGRSIDLVEARNACELPVLRKDFMIDPWQVAEARALGADCILVIMAAVDDSLASELYHTAFGYGMDVLVEVHDRGELDRALKLPSPLIGVNSRNLKTLKISLQSAAELIRSVPLERFAVSESGIHAPEDVTMMREAGARGFLVGEALLKQEDVGAALRKLRAAE